MSSLDKIICADVIRRGGRIPFARLMELALYCPQFGFYDRITSNIGRSHHYFTSVSTGNLFGRMLAFQFAAWLHASPDEEIHLLEAGADDGRLAFDILGSFAVSEPRLHARLHYWILEPLESRRSAQGRTLDPFAGRVTWFREWRDLPASGVNGIIFSNELLDAMPVHRLGWDARKREWFEWGVELDESRLRWTRLAPPPGLLQSGGLAAIPAELLAVLPDAFTVETCPAATEWWRRAAQSLRRGRLMTFDYGLEAGELFRPERSNGTLRAYYRHQVNSDFLERLGEQDLTAHVNFTLIRAAGEAAGLRTETMVTQSEFLTGILAAASEQTETRFGSTWKREFQTLTHPEHLGRAFQVLVQSRLG